MTKNPITLDACIREVCDEYMKDSPTNPRAQCTYPEKYCSVMCIPEIEKGERLFRQRTKAAENP